MHAAAQALVGHHDFTTFRDLQCQAKSPMKTLDLARVMRHGDEVVLEFASRSFLHRQVRSMTGTLAEVGVGRWSKDDLVAALDARDRQTCGPVAPPDGLCLVGVRYDSEVSKFLTERGGGIHHIALRTPDVDKDTAEMEANGARIAQKPSPGAHDCRVAFVHPKSTGGVLLELSTPPAAAAAPSSSSSSKQH